MPSDMFYAKTSKFFNLFVDSLKKIDMFHPQKISYLNPKNVSVSFSFSSALDKLKKFPLGLILETITIEVHLECTPKLSTSI
jgi:hypothetical protein